MSPAARHSALLLFPALLVCAGCDLGEYEQREDDQRTRVAYFDAENQAVGNPIQLPKHKIPIVVTNKQGKQEKKFEPNPVARMDVFLRPPRGYSSRILKEDDENPYNKILYRYASPREGVHDLFLAASIDKKKTFDAFHTEVRQALEQFYSQAYKKVYRFKPETPKTDRRQLLKTRRDSGTTTLFQKVTYQGAPESGVSFQVYFYKAGADQVAIVFEMGSNEARDLDGVIDYSLKSFDIRAAAANKRRAFLSRPG